MAADIEALAVIAVGLAVLLAAAIVIWNFPILLLFVAGFVVGVLFAQSDWPN